MKQLLLAGIVSVALASPALAGTCPKFVKAIDAAVAENPQISAAQLEQVKQLRDDGDALHKESKHTEALAALNEAKKILGIM